MIKSGLEAIHVNEIFEGSVTKDIEISKFADLNKYVVISKDEDFENLHFAKQTPSKLIRVLLGNTSTSELILIFEKHIPELEKLDSNSRFYVEISKNQFVYTTEYELE